MRRTLPFLAVPAVLALLAPPAPAQAERAQASLYARLEGREVRVALQIRIDPGWHLYHDELGPPDAVGRPTKVALSGAGVEFGPVIFPEPERLEQPGLAAGGGDTFILGHHGSIALFARGTLVEGTELPAISASFDGLTCEDEGSCVEWKPTVRSKGRGSDRLFVDFPSSAPAEAQPQEKAGGAGEPSPRFDLFAGGGAGEAEELSGSFYSRRDGAAIEARVELRMAPSWHLYHTNLGHPEAIGLPTTVELLGTGVEWGAVAFPAPEEYTDPAFGHTVKVHRGTIVLKVAGTVSWEPRALGARIAGQVCEESDLGVCIPVDLELADAGRGPERLFDGGPVASAVRAPAGPVAGATGAPGAGPDGENSGGNDGDGGLLAFILLAIGGGLFALVMPCTYPMIPITISFFTKQADARGGNVLPLSLVYGAGIVTIFVLIGVVVGPIIIAFAVHPVTNLVIGLLFILFAVVLFGVIDLRPPRFLMNVAGKASMRGGYLGVFLMGATLVVTSFTCTAPFVGSLLGVAGKTGDMGRIALGMGVFGATMAVPFIFLSLLPGKIRNMPQSGEWMSTVKVTLGFVELAAALKFISNSDLIWQWNTLSRELFLLLWAGIFALAAVYLCGWVPLKGHATKELGPGRMTSAIGFLLFALYCWHGYAGNEMDPIMTAIVPPYSSRIETLGRDGAQAEPPGIVVDDYERARERARREGKLLLVNFTGHT